MMIPEYTEQPFRSCHQALKLLRMLLKGYFVESRDAMQPRMPKWWWLQQNFDALRGHSGLRGTLIIMREKKGTRRGKSLYYQTLREKGIYPRERVHAAQQNAPLPRRGGRTLRFTAAARQTGAFAVDPFGGGFGQQAQAQPAVAQFWNAVAPLDRDGNF